MPRTPLPPPPPPEHLWSWPDHESLLAERARAMGELQRRGLSFARLALLWSYGLIATLGWILVSLGLGAFEARNADYVTGVVELVLGLFFLMPAVIGVGFDLARDRTVRGRLDAWAALRPDPGNDHRLRAGGRSAGWLGLSVALCLIGLVLAFTGVGQPGSGGIGETAYLIGTGVIALVIGGLGVLRVRGHQRWAGNVLSPVSLREGGGAHR
ncbi:hypothetical protein [Streptomyces sp. NBC_01508]|uniref:hypothetical protein n=1 Tax=Streptomyces sp. NBC_01508 TaxID=2903888 RepID=UPI00386315CE